MIWEPLTERDETPKTCHKYRIGNEERTGRARQTVHVHAILPPCLPHELDPLRVEALVPEVVLTILPGGGVPIPGGHTGCRRAQCRAGPLPLRVKHLRKNSEGHCVFLRSPSSLNTGAMAQALHRCSGAPTDPDCHKMGYCSGLSKFSQNCFQRASQQIYFGWIWTVYTLHGQTNRC